MPTPDRYTSSVHYQMSPLSALSFIALLPDTRTPDGRVHYSSDAEAISPRLLPSRDASVDVDLVPGSLVLDIGGPPWYALPDGTTDQLASMADVGDLADLPVEDTLVANIVSLADRVDGLDGDQADHRIPANLALRFDVTGTWTLTRQGPGQYRLRRTAAAANESVVFVIDPPQRSTANKGFRVTGLRMAYEVSTAVINDITVEGVTAGMPANGTAVQAGVQLGAPTYDNAHDTAAERKAVAAHTMSVTWATPLYLNAGQQVEIKVAVDGTAGGVLDITKVELVGTWTDGAAA